MPLFKNIWSKIFKMKTIALLLVSLIIIGLGTFIIYFIEKETFETPFEAFWWVMTTVVTVGYGDVSPETVLGKAFTIVFLYVFGIGVVGLTIGKIIEEFSTHKRLKEEGKLKFNDKNHYIFVGWSKKTQNAIEEIFEEDKYAKTVIIDELSSSPFQHDNVHYIQGDASEEKVLMQANILESKCVSVFSDDNIHNNIYADGKTLLIASAVESLSQEHNKSIYTIVEIAKESNISKFRHANVDEFVLSTDSVSRIMAQAILQNGSSELFRELMSKKDGENLYEISKKDNWNTYRDAFNALIEQGAILVWDKNKKAVNKILDERIPDNSKLFIICDSSTYNSLK